MRSLDNDHKRCEYALIRCEKECIVNEKVVHLLRRDLHNHLKNECPNREHPCPHCKTIGRYCDITTTHLDTCLKLEIPCPNIGCDFEIPRCDLSNHQSTCQFEKVPCTYAEIGCEEEPLRKDLEQHENDDDVHLHHWRRKRGGAGGCSPPEHWTQGAAPPYKFASMGVGNKV